MADLLVVEFPSEEKAEGVRELLLAMRREYRIAPADAVVAVREAGGQVKLSQLLQPTERDADPSSFWGLLIGLLCRSAPETEGSATSATRDRLRAFGIDKDFRRSAARTLQSGNAALLLFIRGGTTDAVLAALRRVGGPVLHSSFDHTDEAALRGLDGAKPPG